MNPHFWPEDIPLPNQDVRFPQITLITKGFRIAPKHAFQPFHYGNTFQIRTIAWLVYINFISLDDLTKEDRDELEKYHSSPEGQLVWSLDDDDSEFAPTAEQKNAWLEKYNRRDAFLHRKKVLDLVRRKDVFMMADSRKNFPRSYHYDRDLQGGRLRRVHPQPILPMGKNPTLRRRLQAKDDEMGKILKFPPTWMPSKMEDRALLVALLYLEPHPLDSLLPARRFWPIHIGKRKRVLSVFPVPQTLPPSKYMLQDAPTPVLCWNRPFPKLPAGLRLLPMPSIAKGQRKEQVVEKRAAQQGKVTAKGRVESKRKLAARGMGPPIGKVAAQDNAICNGAGVIASAVEPLSSGSTLPSQPASSSRDKDIVMAEVPACSSPAASERQPNDADTAPATVSDSAQAKKRKHEDDDSDDVFRVPPARRAQWTIEWKPSASAQTKKAPGLPLIIRNGTNQIPSARGRALHLPKHSRFPPLRQVVNSLSLTKKIELPNGYISCYEDLGVEPLLYKLESLANMQGIERHRNPNRQKMDWGTWRRLVMANWVLVPSPLRESVTCSHNEATGECEFASSCALNHKWSVEEFEKVRKEKRSDPAEMVVAEEAEEEEDVGVLLPEGMPRKPEVDLGWRLKGARAILGNILPGGGLSGRQASGIWSGPVVQAQQVDYTYAAGWTGQPLVE
ncbi:hypothetical protein BDZ89DRAFT_1066754 [Hymenopellis radicata]|nr:hypothetical protein BDZ89DRAFT_1066754 [Hymenopellis radicata]